MLGGVTQGVARIAAIGRTRLERLSVVGIKRAGAGGSVGTPASGRWRCRARGGAGRGARGRGSSAAGRPLPPGRAVAGAAPSWNRPGHPGSEGALRATAATATAAGAGRCLLPRLTVGFVRDRLLVAMTLLGRYPGVVAKESAPTLPLASGGQLASAALSPGKVRGGVRAFRVFVNRTPIGLRSQRTRCKPRRTTGIRRVRAFSWSTAARKGPSRTSARCRRSSALPA